MTTGDKGAKQGVHVHKLEVSCLCGRKNSIEVDLKGEAINAEMLEALKLAVNAVNGFKWKDQAREAIAKAEGRVA